jgi:uncharacterized membrane protein
VTQTGLEVSRREAGVPVALRRPAPPAPFARLGAFVRAHTIGVVIGAWGFVFSGAAVLRHESFQTHRFDLGNMTQAVWNTAHGRFLETTSASGEQFVRLGAHVDPLLAVFAVPWLLWPSPLLLLIVQAVAVSLGALPVYWLARKHLGSEKVAARFVFAYLLYPATQWNALVDFHPVSLAYPLLLFAIWYLDEDRLLAFVLFAGVAATAKEEIPLLLAGLGLWYGIRRGRVVAGAAIAGAAAAWFVVDVLVVLPHFAPAHASFIAERYGSIGGSPGDIVTTLVSDPARILERFPSVSGLVFVLFLVVPLAGLSLREPLLAGCALPALLIHLLSDNPQQRSIAEHYTAGIAPFMVTAAVLGAARLGKGRASRAASVAFAAAALTGVLSPLLDVPRYVDGLFSPAQAARTAAVALVPAEAAVSATNKLGGHLSERSRIFSVPTIAEARWIVVDVNDPTVADGDDRVGFGRFLRAVERDRHWRRVFACEGVLVFHRAAASEAAPSPAGCRGS